MLKLPVWLLASAAEPIATFQPPVVLSASALKPTAVLAMPVVRLSRAKLPSAVLAPEYPPSGGGLTACVFWTSAKQASATGMRNRPSREGDLPIDFIKRGVVIFCFFAEDGLLNCINCNP